MIDREKVQIGLESLRDICNAKSNMAIGKGKVTWAGYANAADDALAMLKEQEANKPKIGHWVFESQYYEAWLHTCSECGKRTTTKINEFANWCWNCGAKMEEINTVPFESVPQLITGSFLTNSQVKKLKDTFKDFTVVVRCRDCKHYEEETGICDLYHAHGYAETWFCADGKRREAE